MHDLFTYRLVTFFTASIVIWALFAYVELWLNHTMGRTAEMISKILHSENKPSRANPPDYSIAQGFYKGRKIICRMSHFTAPKFLHYNLRLHVHIEPRLDTDSQTNYKHTSLTSIRSYFLPYMINQHELIQIFEDLTRAAEIVESQTQTDDSGPYKDSDIF